MRYASAALLLLTLAASAAQPRAIDVVRSNAQFTVQHIWVEHVSGTVPILSGSLVLVPGSAIPLSATAAFDATRISTGEPDRDRSLESPDFFDSAKFPRWTFASTQIIPEGTAAFEMDGVLTIHGVAQPERLQVSVDGSVDAPRYHATGHIDRHAFGMATTRLDSTIGGTADVTLDIVLK